MDLIVAWVVAPTVLLALACGAGLLVERLAGIALPGALVPATGLAAVVVVADFLALADVTADLIVPVAVGLALAGATLGRRRRPDAWAATGALAAFACFAAPIALSGEATFAGYIKLDDTATWLAITDHAIEHGRDLDGLAPSTFEATLAFNVGNGYPIGAFLPLGIASKLTGQDPAWLIQPYMAVWGALLALALWDLARRAVGRRAAAAIAAFAAQPALLYGYYLWGGVKEVAAAPLIATAAGLVPLAADGRGAARGVPLALVGAALIAALSVAGGVWILPALGGAALIVWRRLGRRIALRRVLPVGGLVALLALPALIAGGLWPPTSSPLTGGDARGNLFAPLEPAQAAGIWPTGDFRLDPVAPGVTYVLVAVALAGAALGILAAWRRRRMGAVVYVAGALAAAAAVWIVGSPWVDAKALAIASPAIALAAGLGAALLWARDRRVAAAALGLALAGGIAWSNALAYRDASLAPRAQLAELEEIGEAIAGHGPTLITEYQPYAARHFLRDADPEAASELRRRPVELVDGTTLAKGEWADTDRLDPRGLLAYRTLVLRRTPEQSRPPSPYRLIRRDEHYEVWQRPAEGDVAVVRHVGLGSGGDPAARVACRRVRALGAAAPEGGRLVAARAGRRARADVTLPADGTWRGELRVPAAAAYELWLRGSVASEVELRVDGVPAGSVRHDLNNAGLYARLGRARLEAGRRELTLADAGAGFEPGSGARTAPVEAVVASAATRGRSVRVAPSRAAARLCGRRWDWVEVVE